MEEKESEDEPLKILVCDDDPGFRKLVRAYLRSGADREFVLTEAGRKEEIQEALDKGGFDLIFMDILMPDKSGTEWLMEIVARQLAPVVMITGSGSEELAVQSLHEGAIDYIPKDHLTRDRLWGTVKAALETWKLKQAERLQYVLYQIADAANRTKDLDELFQSIHRYLSTVIETTNFYIALHDREKDALTIPYFVEGKDNFTSFREGKTLTTYVIKKGEPLLATGEVIEELVQSGEVVLIGTPPKVWLGAPLKIGEKVVGALCVQSYENPSIYSEKDQAILKFVSDQIAIVIERKRAEEELQALEKNLQILFDNVLDGILTLEYDGRIINYNSVLARMFEVEPTTAAVGRNALEFVLPEFHDLVIKDLGNVMEGRGGYLNTYKVRSKSGKEYWVEGLGTDIIYEGKQVCLVSLRDITERKLAEEERERLTKELEAKNTELERFTYTVSHDLRSPLITIQGFTDTLREDLERNEEENVERDLKYIETAATKMDLLLTDTLQLSRIGRVTNPLEDVPFGELAHEALEQTAAQIKSSGVEVSVAEDLPTVHVDGMRMVEVLVNLIVNGINYRGEQPQPKIELGHRVEGEETVFFVKDNGIGIDKSQHETVFGLFYTGDSGSKGTGAGLAIVKRIIEVHRGRVWIESEKGEGCTVCFTLPLS